MQSCASHLQFQIRSIIQEDEKRQVVCSLNYITELFSEQNDKLHTRSYTCWDLAFHILKLVFSALSEPL